MEPFSSLPVSVESISTVKCCNIVLRVFMLQPGLPTTCFINGRGKIGGNRCNTDKVCLHDRYT